MNSITLIEWFSKNYADNMEVVDVSGNLPNIVFSRTHIAKYKDGTSVYLTDEFMNTTWRYLDNHKTFLDALAYGESNGHKELTGIYYKKFGSSPQPISGIFNNALPFWDRRSALTALSLKEILESTVWESHTPQPIVLKSGIPQYPPARYDFIAVLYKLKSTPYASFTQFYGNNYAYSDWGVGIIDNSGSPVELHSKLLTDGLWY